MKCAKIEITEAAERNQPFAIKGYKRADGGVGREYRSYVNETVNGIYINGASADVSAGMVLKEADGELHLDFIPADDGRRFADIDVEEQ